MIQKLNNYQTVKRSKIKKVQDSHLIPFKEATIGFEPMNQGVADPRLTAWLCRHTVIFIICI